MKLLTISEHFGPGHCPIEVYQTRWNIYQYDAGMGATYMEIRTWANILYITSARVANRIRVL